MEVMRKVGLAVAAASVLAVSTMVLLGSHNPTLSGRVLFGACGNLPAPPPCVEYLGGQYLRFELVGTDKFFETTSDDSGSYSIELPPGHYRTKHRFATLPPSYSVQDWNLGPRELWLNHGDRITIDFGFHGIRQ